MILIGGKIKNPNYLIGLKNISTKGQKMIIIGGNSANLDVRFDDGTVVHNIRKENFEKGMVENRNFPTLFNVGYLGYGKHKGTDNKNKDTQEYTAWHGMLERCCSPKYAHHYPAYQDCSVDKKWYNFQNFAEWYLNNNWLGDKCFLDKDILFKGNRIYSEDTCCLVDRKLNGLFTTANKKRRGLYPIGVTTSSKSKNFEASYRSKYLGTFTNTDEAFNAYKNAKENYIKQVANEYKAKYPNFPEKLYQAMYKYEVEITD